MLRRELDSVPHFEVTRIDGTLVRYATIWQRKNLVLVVLPAEAEASEDYVSRLSERMTEITAHETECVITRDPVAGIQPPAVVVADRWGEVHFVATPGRAADLPAVDEVIDWLRFVQIRCPECEGESR